MDSRLVYIPDKDSVWIPKALIAQEGSLVTVTSVTPDQQPAVDIDLTKFEKLLKRCNRGTEDIWTLPMINKGSVGLVGDMTQLGFLGEPQILYNLRHRFENAIPYTATGDVIVAVNPYVRIPNLYGTELGASYMKQAHLFAKDGCVDNELPPHVYTTSARAFADLISKNTNQSVLVSGESGAGKTETTKIMINFLVGSDTSSNQATKILGANPLLESFGNAKTVRNDNSSRFGKYTTIQFANNPSHVVLGSYCTVYLLEKSRVVIQSGEERNYHFFYQLLRGYEDIERLGLTSDPSLYRYLENGQHDVDGMDDALHFQETVTALELIGTSKTDITSLIEIIAAVLHLGNINISSKGEDNDDESNIEDLIINEDSTDAKESKNNGATTKKGSPLYHSARLLGVPGSAAVTALCSRVVVTPTESYHVPTKTQEAKYRLEALSKDLYAKTFGWLVDVLNSHISYLNFDECQTISILDIFGFECFEHNTFEQLCINYANEKLQQRFTQDVLASVQLEYKNEGISWVEIEFEDNGPCLKMIEGRLGLLAIIEEETARSSTDQKMSNKLEKILNENEYFNKPKLVRCGFEIKHYAGVVRYDCNTFIAKNADALATDLTNLMKSSSNTYVQQLYTKKVVSVVKKNGGTAKRSRRRRSSVMIDTVTSQFKRNLNELMVQISSTDVNYIRCIKPNALKSPKAFDNRLVCDQLRYSGVVEAIEISRAAFPNRMQRSMFKKRFGGLVSGATAMKEDTKDGVKDDVKDDVKDGVNDGAKEEHLFKLFVQMLFNGLAESPTSYVVGKTNVYFASGKLEELETRREQNMSEKAILLQALCRRWLAQTKYQRLRASIVLQKYARRRLVFKAYQRKKNGVVVVQTLWRRKVAYSSYETILKATLLCQSQVRVFISKRIVHEIRKEAAATQIQTSYRGTFRRASFLQTRASVVTIQSLQRQRNATRLVSTLLHEKREEAKLENQVAALKKQLKESLNNPSGNSGNQETMELVESLKKDNDRLKAENDKLQRDKRTLEIVVMELKSALENERSVVTATRTTRKKRAISRENDDWMDRDDNVRSRSRSGSGSGSGSGSNLSASPSPPKTIRKRSGSTGRLRVLIDHGITAATNRLSSLSKETTTKTPKRTQPRMAQVEEEEDISITAGITSSSTSSTRRNNGPPVPVSATRDGIRTPNSASSDTSSSSNPRRRSWLRRMFSGNETPDGGSGHFPLPSASSPSASMHGTPGTATDMALQRRSGRGWVCLKHAEWKEGRAKPFYIHLRLITGGYVGMSAKRVAERMVPTDGWSSNYVFVATPLRFPSRENPAVEEKLVALRYSLSQTHLAPQSFFMGWSKKLGAHTDQGDRCTPNEWFGLEPVENEESVFAVRHYGTNTLLSVGKDSSVGFAEADRIANVDEAVKARTMGIDEVALVQIEVLEEKDEYDVVFTSFQLGLRVSRTTPIVVRSFTRTETSVVGEAERIGCVSVGDSIIAVQGMDVSNQDRRTVLRAISESDRPLTIRFRSSRPENDAALMGPDRETFERALA